MNINLSQQNEGVLIEVLGELTNPSDVSRLQQLLLQHPDCPLELRFYDARVVPAEPLLLLLQLQARGVALKIRVYHHYLLHYLMQFHLPVLSMVPLNDAPPLPEIKALVLGGSADSLDKIFAIIAALPVSPCSIFIVQHFPENELNRLDQLLRIRTDYQVEMPHHLCEIQPSTIYIAPSGHHMKVAHGKVYLTCDRKLNFARPSIEALFRSVAEEYGQHAMAVLLCGYGNDGVEILSYLRQLGCYVLVENSQDCAARDLTNAAITSGQAHQVLALPELCCFIASALAGRSTEIRPELVSLLLEALFYRYGYDYRDYQHNTVLRRLAYLLSQLQCPDFFALQKELLLDADVFERLFLELSINVTEFFRHPEQMRLLREQVFPYLASFPQIKIWSAGCASGKEVYSLAILLDELGLLHKSQIFATDINPYQLTEARNGLYAMDKYPQEQQNYRDSGGQRQLEDWFTSQYGCLNIAPHLLKQVQFYTHSLTHDGPFQEFQLIVCRNVLIYFHPELQRKVITLFSRSLHPDGFLLLGPSENTAAEAPNDFFTVVQTPHKLYRWKDA